jgi:hypothetical protein
LQGAQFFERTSALYLLPRQFDARRHVIRETGDFENIRRIRNGQITFRPANIARENSFQNRGIRGGTAVA